MVDVEIFIFNNVYIISNGKLMFDSICLNEICDVGEYYCVVFNKFGFVRSEFLRVLFGSKNFCC